MNFSFKNYYILYSCGVIKTAIYTIPNHRKDSLMLSMGELFPRLSHAPIMEAVIDVRARSEKEWNHESIKERLIKILPDYPKIEEQRALMAEFMADPHNSPQAMTKDIDLKGYIFRATDNPQVAQFQREGFIFSRLEPYENWDSFVEEASRLWQIHREIFTPSDISRLGVRFINRIEAPLSAKIQDILKDPPNPPCGFKWSFNNFFHRDIFSVPDTQYKVNLIRLLEKSETQASYIIDIDVYTLLLLEPDRVWGEHINEMRYLKNKVFFGSITEPILEKLK